MTRLCVPITATTCEQMERDAGAAIAAGADLIELRLDYLDLGEKFPDLNSLLGRAGHCLGEFGVILTCRAADEGGRCRLPESARSEFLVAASVASTFRQYIDFEWIHWNLLPEDARLRQLKDAEHFRLILSRHHLESTPDFLVASLDRMSQASAAVVKIACKANSILDSIRMLDALRESVKRKPTIALCMGETGILTRVLARKFGAFLTFASLEAGKESAPGQVTIGEMKTVYRWDKLSEKTLVYGVVGCPVAHSMSPTLHNAAFDATGHDGIYLPMRVEPAYEDFKAFLDAMLERPWLDLRGLSVTIPHKENLLRYVREHIARHGPDSGYIEPLAARIGVANTLVVRWGGTDAPPSGGGTGVPHVKQQQDAGAAPEASPPPRSDVEGQATDNIPHSTNRNPPSGTVPHLRVYNTDYAGALEALTSGMNITREDLSEMRIAVLGAGGAARAIVAGLRDAGATVYIYNRTNSKARALAAEFGAVAMPWESRSQMMCEIIINCTSMGMWPHVDDTPLEKEFIPPNAIVFDTVNNPIETRFMREARARNALVIGGNAMFVAQAARQFKLWTGIDPPVDLMHQVVIQRLTQREQ